MATPLFYLGEHGPKRILRIFLTPEELFLPIGVPADYVILAEAPNKQVYEWSVDSVDAGPPVEVTHQMDPGDLLVDKALHGNWVLTLVDQTSGAVKAQVVVAIAFAPDPSA